MKKLLIILLLIGCNKPDTIVESTKDNVLTIEMDSEMDYLNYNIKIYHVNSQGEESLYKWEYDVLRQDNDLPKTFYYDIDQNFSYWVQVNSNASEPSTTIFNGNLSIYYNNKLLNSGYLNDSTNHLILLDTNIRYN